MWSGFYFISVNPWHTKAIHVRNAPLYPLPLIRGIKSTITVFNVLYCTMVECRDLQHMICTSIDHFVQSQKDAFEVAHRTRHQIKSIIYGCNTEQTLLQFWTNQVLFLVGMVRHFHSEAINHFKVSYEVSYDSDQLWNDREAAELTLQKCMTFIA